MSFIILSSRLSWMFDECVIKLFSLVNNDVHGYEFISLKWCSYKIHDDHSSWNHHLVDLIHHLCFSDLHTIMCVCVCVCVPWVDSQIQHFVAFKYLKIICFYVCFNFMLHTWLSPSNLVFHFQVDDLNPNKFVFKKTTNEKSVTSYNENERQELWGN